MSTSRNGSSSRSMLIAYATAVVLSLMLALLIVPAASADPGAVTFTARLDAWPEGEANIQLVPVWVVIDNGSDQDIELTYEAFAIVSTGVSAVAASPAPVPRQRLAGAAALEAIESDLAPIGRVDENGRVPIVQPVGPADPTGVDGSRAPDAEAFQHNYWGDIEASEWMYNSALADGTIAAGASAEGLLFFSRVAIEGEQVRLRLHLADGSLMSEELTEITD